MPTYEYSCRACGHAFEEIQKMSDPALDTCPKCEQKSAQRLISQGNFILKGGGWYTTGGYGSPGKPKGDDGGGDGGSSTKKADTKSDTKSDTTTTPSTPTTPSGGSSSGSGTPSAAA